jgi:NAD(P)-dependent dehydrogenase (short-subunit alcohol dehydrogenase family)
MDGPRVVIAGGTAGLGNDLARLYIERGRRVVITGRDLERTKGVAAEMGDDVGALALDMSDPTSIGGALADVGAVDRLAVCGVDRDMNSVRDYDVAAAMRLATLKLVGYTEVVHTLLDRFTDDASIVIYGGLAKLRPYPGSATVTTVNAAVDGLVRAMVEEVAPVRVNALHPGIAADSPYWATKQAALDAVKVRTPTHRWVQMRDVSEAAVMLLENPSINGIELRVDGGWSLP